MSEEIWKVLHKMNKRIYELCDEINKLNVVQEHVQNSVDKIENTLVGIQQLCEEEYEQNDNEIPRVIHRKNYGSFQ